jgi:hypothetical protein
MSKLTSHYRRKAVVITDQRVRLMNEVLTCVKLIKMYAWEKPFAKTISGKFVFCRKSFHLQFGLNKDCIENNQIRLSMMPFAGALLACWKEDWKN